MISNSSIQLRASSNPFIVVPIRFSIDSSLNFWGDFELCNLALHLFGPLSFLVEKVNFGLHLDIDRVLVPQLLVDFLNGTSSGGSQRTLAQRLESFLLPLRHISWIGQPVILGPFETVHPLFHQLPVLLASNLVHGLSQIFGHMKTVKRDLLLGPRHTRQRGLNVRRPHIHTHALNLPQLRRGKSRIPSL